jgi:hypothetical protein
MGLISKHLKRHDAHDKRYDQGDDDPPAHDAHGSITAHCLSLSKTVRSDPHSAWIININPRGIKGP